MPLSCNEIKTLAIAFTNEWKDEESEALQRWKSQNFCMAKSITS
jgi:hypothetical protein